MKTTTAATSRNGGATSTPTTATPTTTDQLVAEALELVHSGVTPADAAGQVLTHKILSQLNPHSRRSLAVIGLAHLVNDELAAERVRKVDAELAEARRKGEEARRRRVEEERQAEARQREFRRKPELQAEATRLHELTSCPSPKCSSPARQARCLGGYHVLFLPLEEREAVAAARRQDHENHAAFLEKIHRIHAEIRCSNHSCAHDEDKMIDCVSWRVLSSPEEKQAERIAYWRHLNEEEERSRHGFFQGIIDYCKDEGYQEALANLGSIRLMAADNTMKSLLDFSRDDVVKWEGESAVRAAGWKARNEWFALASATLEEAEVNSIGELPPEKIRQLAEHAERVWKKDAESEDEE